MPRHSRATAIGRVLPWREPRAPPGRYRAQAQERPAPVRYPVLAVPAREVGERRHASSRRANPSRRESPPPRTRCGQRHRGQRSSRSRPNSPRRGPVGRARDEYLRPPRPRGTPPASSAAGASERGRTRDANSARPSAHGRRRPTSPCAHPSGSGAAPPSSTAVERVRARSSRAQQTSSNQLADERPAPSSARNTAGGRAARSERGKA